MMWGMDGGGWWWFVIPGMIVFWVAVIAGAAGLFSSTGGRSRRREAEEILADRLARGEIDVEEYERRKDALGIDAAGSGRPRRGVLIGAALILAVLVIVPVSVMAANDWDMWDMHGRGSNTSNSNAVQGGSQANVRIENFAFAPGNLEVPVGATVTWDNRDSAPHDATSRDGSWKTDRLAESESNTLTFDTRGEYEYYCSIHPSMKARLVVR